MYLDNAATTPLSKEVKEYIIEMLDVFGNPSSSHSIGEMSKNIIRTARENVAKFVGGKPEQIVFTSSGSASNTLAIKGIVDDKCLVLYSPMAHKSMILACESCAHSIELRVNEYGNLDLKHIEELIEDNIDKKPVLCFELASSEVGTIQNYKEICALVRQYGGVVIADATAYIPYYYVGDVDADIITFSAHKLKALKGVGVMYNKSGLEVASLVYGSQEEGLFGGTENVIGVGALGRAVDNYWCKYCGDLRDALINMLCAMGGAHIIGSINRLPNNVYVCFDGCNGELLVTLLDLQGYQVSTGSACNSGSLAAPRSLAAMGVPDEYINGGIRLTLSGEETIEDLKRFVEVLSCQIDMIRQD